MNIEKLIHILFLIAGAALMGALIASLFLLSPIIGALIAAVVMSIVQVIEYFAKDRTK